MNLLPRKTELTLIYVLLVLCFSILFSSFLIPIFFLKKLHLLPNYSLFLEFYPSYHGLVDALPAYLKTLYDFSEIKLILFLVFLSEVFFLGEGSFLYHLLSLDERGVRSVTLDVMCFAAFLLGLFPLLELVFSMNLIGMVSSAREVVARHFHFSFFDDSIWGARTTLKGIVAVLISDFFAYWNHRFSHEWRFYWALHSVHHSATRLSVFTLHRTHPLESLVYNVVFFVPVLIFGGVSSLYFIFVIRTTQNYLNHSNFHFNLGWLGRIFVSPRAHRFHHSNLEKHKDVNYGSMFIFWDRMFGTYYDSRTINKTVGLIERNKSVSIFSLLTAAADFYLGLFKAIRDWFHSLRDGVKDGNSPGGR